MKDQYEVGGSLIRSRAAAVRAAIEWWASACGTKEMRDPRDWSRAEIIEMLPGWCVAPEGVSQDELDAEVLSLALALQAGEEEPWWQTSEEQDVDCAYCGRTIRGGDDVVPAVDDDEAWAEIAKAHAGDCEWVRTRAHRVGVR